MDKFETLLESILKMQIIIFPDSAYSEFFEKMLRKQIMDVIKEQSNLTAEFHQKVWEKNAFEYLVRKYNSRTRFSKKDFPLPKANDFNASENFLLIDFYEFKLNQ